MITNPLFVTIENRYGRDEKKFDICAFARAIAQHLDGFEVVTADENTNYPTVWLKKGNARISLRNGYGSKFGKIEFYASHTGSHVLESHERSLGVKDITVDGTRDPAKVAADVKRRMIDKLPEAIAEIDARIAKRAACVDTLSAIIADLEKAYPGLSFNRRDANATHADVYFNNGGRYLTGSIDADGRLSVQRLSLNTADDARALFAIMSGKHA